MNDPRYIPDWTETHPSDREQTYEKEEQDE